MLQYLINTTITWLACLLIYEVLLRKESFHKYNRIYLLTALAIGLLLPAVQLDNVLPATTTNPTFAEPTKQVYEIRNTIQAKQVTISAEPANYNVESGLWAIYLLGALVGLIIIAREGVHLFSLYNKGRKTVEGNSTIVETGKNHSAFSFFNIIFLNSKAGYNAEQWALLMAHEKEHGRQLHSVDNILLLLLRILFWFHPLPHIYFTRLRVVHEFQADRAAATDIHHYSTFVLEQCLLKGTPLLTHSFNYSPIKKRIAMLTGAKSKRTKVSGYHPAFICPCTFLYRDILLRFR
jgi:bla regulator protein BlaR1